MSTSEDTMSTLGDIIRTSGVYHEYIRDVQYIRGCMWGVLMISP